MKKAMLAAALITVLGLGSAMAAGPGATIKNEAALRICQKALKGYARDPETAVIPDVGAMHGGADWRYLWNQHSRMVRMRNGLGNEVAVIALCVVDEDTGKIKLLTLDGKQLISQRSAL